MLTKTIAISDIHGRFDALKQLVDESKLKEGYSIIFLGDYIGYGEQSIEVIQYLLDLKRKYNDQIILLYGNWEDMLQIALFEKDNKIKSDYIKALYRKGFAEDFKIINNDTSLRNMFKNFFVQLKPYHIIEDYCFVHAGVNIDILLREKSLENILKKSSKEDRLWYLSFVDDLSILKNPAILGEPSPDNKEINFLYLMSDLFAKDIDTIKYTFIVGHVPVQILAKDLEIELNEIKPIVFSPVIDIDLGASRKKGFLGRIMFDEKGNRTFYKVPSII